MKSKTVIPSSKQGDPVKRGKPQQSKLPSRTHMSLGDTVDNRDARGQSMDPNKALVTLKELKLLSQQIIKLQENSNSESEK